MDFGCKSYYLNYYIFKSQPACQPEIQTQKVVSMGPLPSSMTDSRVYRRLMRSKFRLLTCATDYGHK